MRRRGQNKAQIHAYRQAYETLFFGENTFRERLEELAANSNDQSLVQTMIAFIRAGGSRPLTHAIRRGDTGEE
jgi:UDP-N-acetylglucosamine acyltransferase